MINYVYILASLSLFHTALGAVAGAPVLPESTELYNRGAVIEEVVSISNVSHYRIELPKSDRTTITASKAPDGTRVWSSDGSMANDRYKLAKGFLDTPSVSKQGGLNNAGFVQLSGCINLDKAPQLIPSDKGGFYRSSSASVDPNMNFQGSRCEGYKQFVECVQPSNKQFILRCCNDEEDCPAPSGSQKCSDVLKGSYGACAEART
ncbi:hypothetical protein BDN71DRAFT_1441176 [Pleurotus eryngii]|uniref:Uncharacterized protein n=1 Tax=Pleurotus eryngii TaxID=5323 RepID=A0A9P6DB63_PLEER|nr:hypothetical protein BDN71DRAFT_1441176 [Pleurotus eryngii]